MIVCVHDANILIDLAKSGLLAAYAKLGWSTHVPDLVLREVKQEISPYVRSGTIKVRTFDGTEMAALFELLGRCSRRLSMQDCAALHLAHSLNAPLLTGDGVLRKAAQDEGVTCHGFLWILDKLEAFGETSGVLAGGLEAALLHGARLPKGECERRLTRWRGGG